MKIDIREEIEIPERIQVIVDDKITVKGPKGEVKREFNNPRIGVFMENNKIVLESKKATKREKKGLYTMAAHIKNMLHGVVEVHFYELKACAAHFPMSVAVAGKEFIVKNFLGEGKPRKLQLRDGVNVKVNGSVIRIESVDKELAGVTASEMELLTLVPNRDRRIFQDGIFITSKNGKGVL